MIKKLLLFLPLSFSYIFAQNLAISSIPAELRNNAYAVIRNKTDNYTINSINNMEIERETTISVLSSSGETFSVIGIPYNPNTKVSDIKVSIYDQDGKEIKKFNKKDFSDISNNPSNALYVDDRVLYYKPVVSQYPYTLKYSYTTNTSNTAFLDFDPVSYNLAIEKSQVNISNKSGIKLNSKIFDTFLAKVSKSEVAGMSQYTYENIHALQEEALNVPAYKEENFVRNNDNYKTSIKAEVNSSTINNIFRSFTTTWNDVRKRLVESDGFGEQLKKTGAVKNILPDDIKSITNTDEKANAILKFVQNNYKWNKEIDVVTDKGIRNLISTKIGNSAEINLLLIMLMRDAGITANPVVLSTVNRGLLLSYAPSLAQLNYVIAAVESGSKIFLYDATSKYSSKNTIPPRALNYYGFLLTDKDAKQLNIVFPDTSETDLVVNAKLNENGTFSGHFSDTDKKLFALMVRESYEDNKEDYQKEYKDRYKFPFTNIKSSPLENGDFSTSFDFDADTFVDAIGNKLVFNPLLFLYSKNHEFNQEEARKAPLEFFCAYIRNKKVTITLPDGYVFENVPTSKKFRTEDDSISYLYKVTQEGNKLTVETTTTIDDSTFPKEYYPAFKQIFNNITKLESQVVTAVKK